MKHMPLALTLALAVAAFAAPLISPRENARRLEVLFFGAPTKNHPGHDPITRYRVLKKHLGDDGINLTYLEQPSEALDPRTLDQFDAVLMYGNWAQRGPMPPEQRWWFSSYSLCLRMLRKIRGVRQTGRGSLQVTRRHRIFPPDRQLYP